MKKREVILSLKNEGKTNREIHQITGFPLSTISYNTSKKQKIKAKIKRKEVYKSGDGTLRKNKIKIRNREFVDNYIKDKACVDCGISDPRVLDFDHVRGEKVGAISYGIKSGWPLEKLEAEILKCEIRCANCHRIVTHERRKSNQVV